MTAGLIALASLLAPRAQAFDYVQHVELAPGVDYYELDTPVTAYVVALNRTSLDFELRLMAHEVDESGTFYAESVRQLAATHSPPAIAAINGNQWSGGEGASAGEILTPLFSVVTNYNVRFTRPSSEALFTMDEPDSSLLYPVGVDLYVRPTDEVTLGDFYYAAGAEASLLDDAGGCRYPEGYGKNDARSAIGFNGGFVFLVSTSQPASNADLPDLCDIFSQLGAVQAAHLDGGPSAALVVNGEVVSPFSSWANPIRYRFFDDHERHVVNAIGIVPVREYNCSNSADEDGDAAIDCDDSDCADECGATSEAPAPPSLSAPADGAQYDGDDTINFSWGTSGGAYRYGIAVCEDSSLSTGCDVHEPEVGVRSYSRTGASVGMGTRYWAVRAIGADETVSWGDYSTSRRVVVVPSAPSLTAPADGAEYAADDAIPFSWGSATGANRYGLTVCDDSTLSTGCEVYEPGVGVRSYSLSGTDVGTGIRYWAVRSIGTDETVGWGDYSSSRRLVVVPSAPSLIAPADGAEYATDDTVAFTWGSASGANRYGLAVCDDSTLSTGCEIYEPGVGVRSYSLSGADVGTGTRYWAVRSIGTDETVGWGDYSGSRELAIALPADTGAPDVDGDGYDSDTDCDDADYLVNPGAAEVCSNTVDDNCDGFVDEDCFADLDGDGYDETTDCDDTEATVSPGEPEACGNAVDDDCDGYVDEGCAADADGDGYDTSSDCDDTDPSVNPGTTEVCGNSVDDDCDGTTDTACLAEVCYAPGVTMDEGELYLDGDAFYYWDSDGDGYGDPAADSAAYGDTEVCAFVTTYSGEEIKMNAWWTEPSSATINNAAYNNWCLSIDWQGTLYVDGVATTPTTAPWDAATWATAPCTIGGDAYFLVP